MKTLLNICIYQLIWLLCVFAEKTGALISIGLLALHLVITPDKIADVKMMVLFLVIGSIIDGSLYLSGFFSFSSPACPIPAWLAMIWMGLAILPHHSLAWLKNRPVLCLLFGAVGGPLAYWAGVRVGVATFNLPLPLSLIILAVVWAALWPMVMSMANGKPGRSPEKHQA